MSISIVIPVYNEVDSLPHLYRALHEALEDFPQPWEVILVDDGSADGSLAVLEQLAVDDPEHLRVVAFRRNFGQTAAMAAGIDQAVGDIVILMDADLQNDPADIPLLVQKIAEGYDIVCGWRKDRQDKLLTRRIPSLIANRLIARVTGVRLHDYGCTLKAFRREVIKGFRLYGEMHRFIPPYAVQVGGKMLELPVRHHARKFGQTKYGLGRTLKVVMDLLTVRYLTAFAHKPMYFFGRIGLNTIGLGALGLVALAGLSALLHAYQALAPWMVLSAISMVLGIQFLGMGLIAEQLMRTYYESQGKPPYVIKRVVNGRTIHDTTGNQAAEAASRTASGR